MSKVWYKAECFDKVSYEREIELDLLRNELKPLKEERTRLRNELTEVRKKPYWEDRIPYIHKLNKRLDEIEKEIEAVCKRFGV